MHGWWKPVLVCAHLWPCAVDMKKSIKSQTDPQRKSSRMKPQLWGEPRWSWRHTKRSTAAALPARGALSQAGLDCWISRVWCGILGVQAFSTDSSRASCQVSHDQRQTIPHSPCLHHWLFKRKHQVERKESSSLAPQCYKLKRPFQEIKR